MSLSPTFKVIIVADRTVNALVLLGTVHPMAALGIESGSNRSCKRHQTPLQRARVSVDQEVCYVLVNIHLEESRRRVCILL